MSNVENIAAANADFEGNPKAKQNSSRSITPSLVLDSLILS